MQVRDMFRVRVELSSDHVGVHGLSFKVSTTIRCTDFGFAGSGLPTTDVGPRFSHRTFQTFRTSFTFFDIPQLLEQGNPLAPCLASEAIHVLNIA